MLSRCCWRMVVVVAAVAGLSWGVARQDPPPLVVPGDVVIGVVADLHEAGPGGLCGALQPRIVELVVAAQWALEQESQRTSKIGLRVYDACGDMGRAQRQVARLLQDAGAALLGVVALGSSQLVAAIAAAPHTSQTPVLITDAHAAHTTKPAHNLFTTAPHLTDHLKFVLRATELLGNEGGKASEFSVVSSGAPLLSDVLQQPLSRPLPRQLKLDAVPDLMEVTDTIQHFIRNEVSVGSVVVVLLRPAQLRRFTSEVDEQVLRETGVRWVLTTPGGEPLASILSQQEIRNKFNGSLLVESHSPVTSEFSKIFCGEIHKKTSLAASIADQYLDTVVRCDSKDVESSSVTATVSAVSSLSAAFRRVQIEKCRGSVPCLEVHKDVLKELLNVPFGDDPSKIRFIAGKLDNNVRIMRITPHELVLVKTDYVDKGRICGRSRLKRQALLRNRTRNPVLLGLLCSYGGYTSVSPHGDHPHSSLPQVTQETRRHKSVIKTSLLTHEDYIRRTWAFTVLATACLGVVASLYIMVYVALRVCDGTLHGPQVLGTLLLLGVMGVFASCVVYVLSPSAITCSVRQWAPTLCLALCYGVLLVKSMQLRALVSVGAEGKVSQVNLHITLLFIVAVQIALCMLGHAGGLSVGEDPLVRVKLGGGRLCGLKPFALLATRVYLLLLLLLCLILAAFNHNIERNHNEGQWLLLTSCVSAPVVVAWSVMSYLAPPSLEAPTTSVALLILASLIIGLIFIPKMRIIAQQTKQFKHQQLAAPASVSTVLSQVEDWSLVEGMRQLRNGSPQHSHHPSYCHSPQHSHHHSPHPSHHHSPHHSHHHSPHHSHQQAAGSLRSSAPSQKSYLATVTEQGF